MRRFSFPKKIHAEAQNENRAQPLHIIFKKAKESAQASLQGWLLLIAFCAGAVVTLCGVVGSISIFNLQHAPDYKAEIKLWDVKVK